MLGIGALGQPALGQFFKGTIFVTVPNTIRAYAFSFDRNGSPVYWYIDTATGLAPVDNHGRSLNPFTSR